MEPFQMQAAWPPPYTSLIFSPAEVELYTNILTEVDRQHSNRITGADGAAFLRRSGLPQAVLHEIWSLCDPRDEGFLDRDTFAQALRLVAHAQMNMNLTEDLIHIEPPALPVFHPDIAGEYADPLGVAVSTQQPGDWTIPSELRHAYLDLFNKHDTDHNGFVEGSAARSLLTKSGLDNGELYMIWKLADRDQDGRLSVPEFIVCMHLASRRREGIPLPESLPAELAAEFTTAVESIQNDVWEPPTFEPAEFETRVVDHSFAGAKSQATTPGPPSRVRSYEERPRALSGELEVPHHLFETKTPDVVALLQAYIQGDNMLAHSLTQDTTGLAESIGKLEHLTSTMTREIESSRSELVQQLNRRNDFSNRVEALKFEYEKLAAERRSILAEKGECTASIASLQEEVVFLKRLIKEAENDLETHILLNETIRTQNKKAETEVEHLAGSRDTLLRALQNERIAVQQEERLIAELKNSLSRFRSEKAQMTQDGAVLLERSRNLTQDRMMLMSAVTQDQAELLNLRGSLCDLKDQKRALSLEVQSKAFTAVESRQGLPRSSHRPDRPARDRKGIKFQPPPNLQTQGLQAQVNPNVPLMQYPHKDTWTRFEASTCPAAPVREDRGGIGDILGRALSNRAEDSTSLVRLPDKSSEGSRSARPESRFSSMTDPFKALDEAPAFGQPVSSCQH